jgi:hypothetical protein
LEITGLAEAKSGGRQMPFFALSCDDATGSRVDAEVVNQTGGGVQLLDVAPGDYVIESRLINEEEPGLVARRRITVSGAPPARIELRPVPTAKIDVRVRDTDGRPVADGLASIAFVPTADGLLVQRPKKSSAFILDPGAYWLSIRAKESFCAAAAHLNGQDVLFGRTTIVPAVSSRLDVELSKRCGDIEIHTVEGEKSAPFSDFILLLSGTPKDPGGVITGTSDVQAHASIGLLTPGRYLVWAWAPGAGGYVGPDLADAAGKAVEVVVNAGQTSPVSVGVIQPEGLSK